MKACAKTTNASARRIQGRMAHLLSNATRPDRPPAPAGWGNVRGVVRVSARPAAGIARFPGGVARLATVVARCVPPRRQAGAAGGDVRGDGACVLELGEDARVPP